MEFADRSFRRSDNIVVAPRLFIVRNAWDRLRAYVTSKELRYNEINGYGYVTMTPEGHFAVDDVFITKQEVTPGTAKASGFNTARALDRADLDGRGDDFRLQWHSHVTGEAYFSPTDMDNIEEYGKAGMAWVLSIVTNIYGDIAARVDSFPDSRRPFPMGTPLEWSIIDVCDGKLQAAIDQEVAKLVTIEKPKPMPRQKSRRATPRVTKA